MGSFALVGTVVDATDDWKLNVEEKCLIVVDENGKIAFKGKNMRENLDNAKERLVFLVARIDKRLFITMAKKNRTLLVSTIT